MTKQLDRFNREFEKMKPIVHERSGGRCEAPRVAHWYTVLTSGDVGEVDSFLKWHVFNCNDRATEVHHRRYRGKSRGGTNAESNLLHVSKACHDWIHAHGGFGQPANLLGLALSAGQGEEL